MAEELQIDDDFSVDLQWPTHPGEGGNPLLDASLARFQIMAAGKSITAYETESGNKNSFLTIPAYYLVEWLAKNWWAFLHEPRKHDRDDFEFRSRHWMGTARNGFALPDTMFCPSGAKMEIVTRAAFLRFARMGFTETLTAIVSTELVQLQFSTFVDQILNRLSEKGVDDSEAHDAWKRVKETTEEEKEYCRLLGSMGLSPYLSHPDIDKVLEEVASK